jgi:calcineurin-like phosphoesterase family protein
MQTFFTADTHFFHEKMVDLRGCRDVGDMHYQMVNSWNAKVGKKDRVIHLGDLTFGRTKDTIAVLRVLNGFIEIVPGNHDRAKALQEIATALGSRFKVLPPLLTAKIATAHGGTTEVERAVLCHFPLLVWDRAHYGVPQLHGHSHGNCRYPDAGARLDVGVDACADLAPMSWAEVKEALTHCTHKAWDQHVPKAE